MLNWISRMACRFDSWLWSKRARRSFKSRRADLINSVYGMDK
jgi:hypothetical protein